MNNKRFDIIYCPECGMEYLPAEIYLPNELLGKPYHIIKDFKGSILDFTGNSMNMKESYICDKCGSKFRVTARVNFKSEIIDKESFDKEYITKIPSKIRLFED
jgi:DNA-directed RNA polymerase subunit RPC12/RpoP